MKNIWLLIFCLSTIISCKNDKSNPSDATTSGDEISIPKSRTLNKGDYKLDIEHDNQDKSSLQFWYKGSKTEKFEIDGLVTSSFFTDLDFDKDEELFLETKNQKNEIHLVGYVLKSGNPIEIYLKQPRGMSASSTKSFSTVRSQIIESVTYTDKKDISIKKQLRYNLVAGEAGYALKPQGKTTSDLERLIGQYASKDASNAGYYSILDISKNDVGEWVVGIKMKETETKTSICTFLSVGDFVDGDLYVPLNYEKKDIKGNLRIRFIDLNAIVYTEDPADISETTKFCRGSGSIAGTFRKTDI